LAALCHCWLSDASNLQLLPKLDGNGDSPASAPAPAMGHAHSWHGPNLHFPRKRAKRGWQGVAEKRKFLNHLLNLWITFGEKKDTNFVRKCSQSKLKGISIPYTSGCYIFA